MSIEIPSMSRCVYVTFLGFKIGNQTSPSRKLKAESYNGEVIYKQTSRKSWFQSLFQFPL